MKYHIKIEKIVKDEVTTPKNDGTAGSALYKVLFKLNRASDPEWSKLFIEAWNHPPQWTTMHRPGIVSVQGDQIILDGTTIEEVEKYHRRTLELAIEVANKEFTKITKQKELKANKKKEMEERHRKNVETY